MIAAITIGAIVLIVASALTGYYCSIHKSNHLQNHPEGALYKSGTKLKYYYAMNLKESLRLRSAPPNATQTSESRVNVNVTVIVAQNSIEDGGNLKLYIGLELEPSEFAEKQQNYSPQN